MSEKRHRAMLARSTTHGQRIDALVSALEDGHDVARDDDERSWAYHVMRLRRELASMRAKIGAAKVAIG